MTRVLALATAPAEIMHCAFVLDRLKRRDTGIEASLAIYGAKISVPEPLRVEMLAQAGLFYDWTRVIDFCDGTDAIMASDSRPEAIAVARNRLEHDGVDLILTSSIDKLPERAIISAFPQAAIVLYDNGMYTYLQRSVSADNSAWKEALTVNASDLARLVEGHLTLLEVLPRPSYLNGTTLLGFGPEEYRKGLQKIWPKVRTLPDFQLDIGEQATCHLMLGSSFHRIRQMTYREEKAFHLNHAVTVIRRGNDVILFKAKPRQHEQFPPYLLEADRVRMIGSHLPAEFLPLAYNVVGVSSLYSTGLLSLPMIFGMKAELLLPKDSFVAERLPHVRLLVEQFEKAAQRNA